MHEPNFTNVIVNKLRIIASNSSALSFNSQNYFTFDIQILKQLLNRLLPNFNWVINLTLLCRKRSLHRFKIILPKENVITSRFFFEMSFLECNEHKLYYQRPNPFRYLIPSKTLNPLIIFRRVSANKNGEKR